MDFNLNANDRSQGWKFSLSHQQAQNSMEKQRKSGKNEMQLKTGREAWKNSKTGFSQTVRKQFATIANFAMCWQSVRNHCEFRNVLATSFALRKSLTPVHCTFAKFASHKTLAKFRIAKFANHIANFATALRNSQTTFPNSQPIAKFANHFANFANPLPNSQSQLALRNSHLQALSSSVINATDFQTW